jgi:hypothetical protein
MMPKRGRIPEVKKVIIGLNNIMPVIPNQGAQRDVRGAAKLGITAFLLMFYCIRCRQVIILTN